MDKRPNRPPKREIPEPTDEQMAADRFAQSYPRNNFAAGAAVIAGVLVLIGLAYMVGFVK
jgi:hypothetical protein